MMNHIWLAMLIGSLILAMLNGRIEQVSAALLASAGDAVALCLSLLGVICLWNGLMRIAQKSGLIALFAWMARPLLNFLFPRIKGHSTAIGAITMNLAANFLGLGNAATPLGLKAMGELQKLNTDKDTATDEMSMFLVLNTAFIQLVPTTVIAVRAALSSDNPAGVAVTIWMASACSSVVGIFAARIFSYRSYSHRRNKRNKHINHKYVMNMNKEETDK